MLLPEAGEENLRVVVGASGDSEVKLVRKGISKAAAAVSLS